jgi:hypothetical protein
VIESNQTNLKIVYGVMKKSLWAYVWCLFSLSAFAGGIRGNVTSEEGTPLAYASIFVQQTGTGVASDFDGNYEIALSPGSYTVLFQYLGFETITRQVVVGQGFEVMNVTMKTQVVMLKDVVIRAGKEDPAYTIMRKAISKAKYHIQQLDSYSAKVYVKGKGQLKDYPWYAKKALEKEGLTKDRLFVSESVSEIKYTRPNTFEEKVIAVYTNGNENNTSPNGYVFGSFYQPEIAETVSPLSPKSFSYYRFEYLGTIKDGAHEVSKIRVVPRSKGDNVFDGIIFIVEDAWSIHSLDLHTIKLGIHFYVKQIYNPIQAQAGDAKSVAWMPVSQQFRVDGKVFGFEFEYNYLATVRDYTIKLNPELPVEFIVIDEKIQKEEAKKIEQKFSKKGQQIQQRLEAGQEVTRKELNQMVKEYEKQEIRQQKEPDIISASSFDIDSLAYKKDSAYWANIRPLPLTKQEERGYKISDSLSVIEKKREAGDSLKPSKNKGFQVLDLIQGDRYKISNSSDFQIHMPFGGFNTVEGWNLIYKLSYYKRWAKKSPVTDSLQSNRVKRPLLYKRLEISPIARYAFSRETFSGLLRVDYRSRTQRYTLEAGRYVQQYNQDDPIHPVVNTISTLFWADNLMKLYERDFVDFNLRHVLNDKYTLRASASWAQRRELFNRSNYTLFKTNRDEYTPNRPVNLELGDTGFPTHEALVTSIGLEARPWQKYRMRNGIKQRINFSSPLFTMDYRRGFEGILSSDISYDYLEVGLKHQWRMGIRGTLDMNFKAGKFLSRDQMYFMDYQHFLGNLTPIITTDPAGSFRLLDYYQFSTRDEFFSANVHYHFRKFLVTRIPKIRLIGITENLFVNYLTTPVAGNYTEVGYGLEGILRLFRLEAAMSFRNSDLQNFNYGFRIGIATSLSINFSD